MDLQKDKNQMTGRLTLLSSSVLIITLCFQQETRNLMAYNNISLGDYEVLIFYLEMRREPDSQAARNLVLETWLTKLRFYTNGCLE